MPCMMTNQLSPARFQFLITLRFAVPACSISQFTAFQWDLQLSGGLQNHRAQTKPCFRAQTCYMLLLHSYIFFKWHTQICNPSTHLDDHHMEETSPFFFFNLERLWHRQNYTTREEGVKTSMSANLKVFLAPSFHFCSMRAPFGPFTFALSIPKMRGGAEGCPPVTADRRMSMSPAGTGNPRQHSSPSATAPASFF